MLNPAIGKLIQNCENRYGLVNEIAKEARKIADASIEKEEIIIEKPVSLAINKVASKRGLL
ncbi:MAG: DNA-directed RNA polymerase subunit omega [Acutalibacteraceae bacterium]|nr:DNA-directed RNA polymerase subunit omega [Acutalibacteraceae bacterium]